jgi:hypothetical protein
MSFPPSDIESILRSFINENKTSFPESYNILNTVDKFSNLCFLKSVIDDCMIKLVGKEELNFSLLSNSIQSSLSSKDKNAPHLAVDYQWLFLNYLIVNFKKSNGLIDYIDDFLKDNRNQLLIKDIGITKSGATRAKTHLRFAVNDLRNMGMIISKDINKKRSWQPSIMGVLILLCALVKPALQERFFKLKRSSLLPNGTNNTEAYIGGVKYYDTRLFDKKLLHLIREYRAPGAFYGVIAALLQVNVADHYKEMLEKLQDNYVDTVLEGLTILEKDVKKTKEFNSLSNKFHSYLANEEKNHEELFKVLHECYKAKWTEVQKIRSLKQ